MIFIDSNIPMYLVGAPHPNKDRTVELLERLVYDGEQLLTSVEVYQEILHRYVRIQRLDAIGPAFEALDALVDDVLGIGMSTIRIARALIRTVPGLSARDALHAAAMSEAGISRILSFDRDFDLCPGIQRVA